MHHRGGRRGTRAVNPGGRTLSCFGVPVSRPSRDTPPLAQRRMGASSEQRHSNFVSSVVAGLEKCQRVVMCVSCLRVELGTVGFITSRQVVGRFLAASALNCAIRAGSVSKDRRAAKAARDFTA